MIRELKVGSYTYKEKDYGFNFYTNLSTANKLKFVNSVVNLVVDGKGYNSVIRNLVFDFYIVDIFSDVDTTDLKQSSFFIDDVEEFLEETNISYIIKVNMDGGLLEELNKAVDDSISYLTGIHTNPLNDSIANFINTLDKKINEVDFGSMMEMANVISSVNGKITPESIVKAYMNSDIYKKNTSELKKTKEIM